MKRWTVVLVGWMLWCCPMAAETAAETRYIREIVKVTVRTGKGIDHKILSMVNSGEQVTVVEPGPEWTRVRLANGIEGYVLTRLLAADIPHGIQLKQLQKRFDALQAQSSKPRAAIAKLEQDNHELKKTLAAKDRQLETLQKTNAGLSKDHAVLKTQYAKLKKTADGLSKQSLAVESYETRIQQLETRRNLWWFLSGAGVLLLGLVIGFSAKRQRRRSSLL